MSNAEDEPRDDHEDLWSYVPDKEVTVGILVGVGIFGMMAVLVINGFVTYTGSRTISVGLALILGCGVLYLVALPTSRRSRRGQFWLALAAMALICVLAAGAF